MEFCIEKVQKFSLELTAAINKLLKQLDDKATPLTRVDVENMIASPANHLFVARRLDNKETVGMLTLIVYRIPVWKKGWIEDLVVDEAYRNRGVATKLINYAMESAKAHGVLSLNFTSRPEREAANRLYRSLGFEKRNTNLYSIKL
ncbi:MAG: GNAT family N-acetyltransferase [Patescibacteria group bacterium]